MKWVRNNMIRRTRLNEHWKLLRRLCTTYERAFRTDSLTHHMEWARNNMIWKTRLRKRWWNSGARTMLTASSFEPKWLLHMHVLIQLHGFAHPEDLFGRRTLTDTVRRVWHFVASICFRSTEAFAAYLGEDAAMDALQVQPLLSL